MRLAGPWAPCRALYTRTNRQLKSKHALQHLYLLLLRSGPLLDLADACAQSSFLGPSYDEARGTVHLDVMGKEYVFRADSKEETMEWFVALASGCGLA